MSVIMYKCQDRRVVLSAYLKLTLASDLSRFLRRSVKATDELEKESLFERISLTEILLAGGVKFEKSRVENLALSTAEYF